MYILVEGVAYKKEQISTFLSDSTTYINRNGDLQFDIVGYLYDVRSKSCIIVLPKVILDKNGLVLGRFSPAQMVGVIDDPTLDKETQKFLYRFSLLIYRSISDYSVRNPLSSIVRHSANVLIDSSSQKSSGTLVDVILSILAFQRDNKDFIIHTIRKKCSLTGRVHWRDTIVKESPVIQEGEPIYVKLRCGVKEHNREDDLLMFYFSILNYIEKRYGFNVSIDSNYPIFSAHEFEKYLSKLGINKMRSIRRNYFSDRLTRMWQLCYNFINHTATLHSSRYAQENLYTYNFEILFESIVDSLLADSQIEKKLQEQPDGKVIDHIFKYKALTGTHDIFYIADSKYYKTGASLGENSIFKQYTYARNVITYNVIKAFQCSINNVFPLRYRDDFTEGYDITPNFFISAKLDKIAANNNAMQLSSRGDDFTISKHFENRLFDRDTLMLTHYDINLAYVLSLYISRSSEKKRIFKKIVSNEFRTDLVHKLNAHYEFYKLKPMSGLNLEVEFHKIFYLLIGKVFKPAGQDILLALEKAHPDNLTILSAVKSAFEIYACELS